MKITKLKLNPANPRVIKDDKFKKLCSSIEKFPKMMELRPIVVDDNYVIVGGNMRYKALQELGYKDIPNEWVKQAKDYTEEELKEFIIKDNVGYGEWDWDDLANNWDNDTLIEWGMDIPNFVYSDKMNELHEEVENIGLPEFDVKEDSFKLIVQFEDVDAREEFAKMHNIEVSKKGNKFWTTWWPFKERNDMKSLKYE